MGRCFFIVPCGYRKDFAETALITYTLDAENGSPRAVVENIKARQRLLVNGVTPEEATLLTDFAAQVKKNAE